MSHGFCSAPVSDDGQPLQIEDSSKSEWKHQLSSMLSGAFGSSDNLAGQQQQQRQQQQPQLSKGQFLSYFDIATRFAMPFGVSFEAGDTIGFGLDVGRQEVS